MYHHDTDSPYYFSSVNSHFHFGQFNSSTLILISLFHSKSLCTYPKTIGPQKEWLGTYRFNTSLCSVRFMSITAFDLIDKFFQDTSLQLQCVSFDQLIALTVKLPFSCSVIFGQLTFSQLWLITHSSTSLEAQFPFRAFSIFPYSQPFCAAVCCGQLLPDTFNFSILIVDDFALPFGLSLRISEIYSIRILLHPILWQIHLDQIWSDIYSLKTWTRP